MNGLATLRHINNEADMAGQLKRKPLKRIRWVEQLFKSPDYSAVNIDLLEHVSGLNCIETFFVDTFGNGEGLAISINELQNRVQEYLDEGKKIYACLTGVGQFQVYLSIFEEK